MKFNPATPVLRIFDEARAREFYIGFLGFNVDFEHRFEPNTPIYMGLSRDGCRLHLSEHHGDGCPGANVRIEVDEVDAYQQSLLAKAYKYYRPGVDNTDWGTREMRVQDPFGNSLTFFNTLPKT